MERSCFTPAGRDRAGYRRQLTLCAEEIYVTPANIPPTWSAIETFPETDAADFHWEIWNEFIEIGSEVKLT